MLGIHRCHFPSAGAEVVAAGMVAVGAVAGMVEVGTAAGLLVVGMEVGTAAGTAEIIRQLSLYRLSTASQRLEVFSGS